MRPTLAALGAALALAACDTGTIYYAEGVDIATREADYAQCEIAALQEFPVRTEIRYTPSIFVPGRQVCDAQGACTVTPGRFEGGQPYTVDANADIRATATRGCMGERGYARVGLPFCEPETAIRPSVVMPPLGDGTCLYQPGGSGPALVVNPI
jgi:hypothetical protein